MVDAIQSVRSGEMSVHRAGTHYGVPHSTLEYKVKNNCFVAYEVLIVSILANILWIVVLDIRVQGEH